MVPRHGGLGERKAAYRHPNSSGLLRSARRDRRPARRPLDRRSNPDWGAKFLVVEKYRSSAQRKPLSSLVSGSNPRCGVIVGPDTLDQQAVLRSTAAPFSAEVRNVDATARDVSRACFNGVREITVVTYLIGAGASRHAQYPLASEMGKGLIEFMLGMDQHPFAPIQARCLIEQFGHEPNIEEVVTELGLRTNPPRRQGFPQTLPR